jgi:stage V sporulation protein AC
MAEKVSMKEILAEEDPQKRKEKYNSYVTDITPKHNLFVNLFWAFVIGGAICTLGQALIQLYRYLGAGKEDAALYQIITLVALSVIFTGLNLYPKLAKAAGAGTVVPITGFANSVAASAIEFQQEGQVFGIGCRIFTIAGPVILYGIFSSWIVGFIYWLYTLYA